MRRAVVRGAALAGALWAAGCAANASVAVSDALRKNDIVRAVELYAREPTPERADLRRIAEVVLVHAAGSRDPVIRARGFSALRSAGTSARSLLAGLAKLDGRPEISVRALALLAAMGDLQAGTALSGWLAAPDGELRAAAVAALDPARDAVALRSFLADPSASVRAAAAERLANAPADGETQLALARAARHDPALAVRLRALQALGAQGPGAAPAIEARLDDSEQSVRLAAVGALVAADRVRASERLQRWLREDPRPEAIEAARTLCSPLAPPPPAARDQLARALADPDAALRAQAAVALSSLPPAEQRALAQTRNGHEGLRSVQLWLALALGRAQPDGGAALQRLARTHDLVGAQALAELARAGDAAARRTLIALVHAPQPRIRALAVLVVARELAAPHEVRDALVDRDLAVRLTAASALLAALAH
jgi:HEAT repeat protein